MLTEHLIAKLGYLGITLILILGGLGLPIPEEAPIILAAILSRNGQLWGPFALASCLTGVLLGDLVVYFLGYVYGEKVLSLPLTRRLLTKQREAQIKGYFHRHGYKILLSGRFVPGFRTAAYLTAGILKLPTIKLVITDVVAASFSTFLMFGLGYAFADQIQSGIREAQQWVTIAVAAGLATWLYIRYEKARRRSGLPVGPPVLDSDDVPLPADDHLATAAGPQVELPRDETMAAAKVPREASMAAEVLATRPTHASAAPPPNVGVRTHDSVVVDLDATRSPAVESRTP